jgi:UDP-glucose 4-epimerase
LRVLVTGATGFVGRATVRRLVIAGHTVTALTHQRTVRLPEEVTVVRGDVCNLASLRDVADVDAVCHLAALTNTRDSRREPLRYFQTNTVGTVNLLQALTEARAGTIPSVVFLSTCAVYGEPVGPVGEHALADPRTPYGQSKLAAEHLIAAQAATGAIGGVILRTFNAAGAIDGVTDPDLTRIIPKAIAVAAAQEQVLYINGDGTVVREFVHVDDLAAAIVAALQTSQPGRCPTYNVGSGIGVSLNEIVAATRSVSGRPLRVEHRPPVAEPKVLLADSDRIRRELDWKPARSDLRSIIEDAWQATRSPD